MMNIISRRWTNDEIERMVKMYNSVEPYYNWKVISETLNRSISGCKYKMKNVRKSNMFDLISSFDKKSLAQKGRIFTDEHRNNISKAMKGKLIGYKHTDDTKKKMSRSKIGHKHTDDTKKKISENHADISGRNNPFYGKKHDKQTREKMRGSRPSISGEKNPAWIDGRSYEANKIYTPTFRRNRAILMDNIRHCEYNEFGCNNIINKDNPLETAHIIHGIPDKPKDEYHNLICLCKKCHNNFDKGRRYK